MIVKGLINTQAIRREKFRPYRKNFREDGPSISRHYSLLQSGEVVLELLTTVESSRSRFHSWYSQGFFLLHNIQIRSEEHVGLTPVQRQPFTHSSRVNLSGREAVYSSTCMSSAGVKTAVRPTLGRHKSSAV